MSGFIDGILVGIGAVVVGLVLGVLMVMWIQWTFDKDTNK